MLNLFRQPSLVVQIFLSVGGFVLGAVLAIGIFAFHSVEEEIVEIYDSQLVTSATVLWSLSHDEAAHGTLKLQDQNLPLDVSDKKALRKYAKWRSFRIWRNGVLIRSTGNVPSPASLPAAGGFSDTTANNVAWRIYTLYVPSDGTIIEVGEMAAARDKLIAHVLRDLLIPFSLTIPLAAAAIWLGTQRGLRGLRYFTNAIAERSVNDLSNIQTAKTPMEIAPLAEALNTLLAELGRSLEQERLFTDNAAHELRTPLAILGAQANVIVHAETDTERIETAAELAGGIARTSRLLDQLLTLARIRHAPIENSAFNLYDHACEIIKDLYPGVIAKDIRLALSGVDSAIVVSKRTLVHILLKNLLDNAIKFTPKGCSVFIVVSENSISICDEGPGIPEAERDLVFKRFYRAQGVTAPGSGLGLSIVRNIADILPAEVMFFDPENRLGLGVRVTFPS